MLIKFSAQNYYEITIVNSLNDPNRLWYNVKNLINFKNKQKSKLAEKVSGLQINHILQTVVAHL